MRVLMVSNMWPTESDEAFGSFVATQFAALERRDDVQLRRLCVDPRGRRSEYARVGFLVRRQVREWKPDLLHVHFGLTFPAVHLAAHRIPTVLQVHGTDVDHSRTSKVTAWAARRAAAVVAVSAPLAERLADIAAIDAAQVRVIPTGVDLAKFGIRSRGEARERLGLSPHDPVLLLPADPARPEKRHDRARQVADELGLPLLDYGGGISRDRTRDMLTAAACVLVPSDREGFGLGTVEGLACGTPVVAAPVGVAPEALAELPACACLPFEPEAWRTATGQAVAQADDELVRSSLHERAARYSSDSAAERLVQLYAELLSR